MKRFAPAVLLLTMLFILSCASRHETMGQDANTTSPAKPAEGMVIPLDDSILTGKLDNGLTYFIRPNAKPEGRIELRLAVKAGSVLEDDDQQGLAHFCEHMAFNGTEHFQKHELVDFLESIGMRFGPELNAYTSFDQTVYMLQVPADSAEVVEKAFQILEDWAQNVSYEDDEIDKERGVIIEEWRLGRGAGARIRDKQLPVLFSGSRYAERLPIGKKEIIENAPHDTLRRFYHDWYRPDLMAVMVVGDADPEHMENLVKRHFSLLTMPDNTRDRKLYPVPDHNETLYAIATDPEATESSVSIYWKQDVEQEITDRDYRKSITAALFNSMFNERLDELTRASDPPFQYAYSDKGRFVLSKELYMLSAGVRDNGIERGFETILTEAERVRRYGFTATELERKKTELLRSMEMAFNERDKTESAVYADEYIRHYIMDEPAPGIEYEYELYQKYLPGIELKEVNRLADEWITDSNRVILVDGPDKPGVNIPDEKKLAEILDSVSSKLIKSYVDTVSDKPLLAGKPAPSPVSEERYIDEIGVVEWKLQNGIRIVLKQTDFKNDEILFTSYSPGGNSLVPKSDYIPATTATSIIGESGVGEFNLTELNKKLAGKVVRVSPYIDTIREGVSGNASPKDIETMFQLIYLYITSPRKDRETFDSFETRMRGYLQNRSARPETAFNDTLVVTATQYHYRGRPWTVELLDELDLDTSLRVYRDRFSDTDDFTFFFVGNFDPEVLKPLVETYIGGLPVTDREETWKDPGIEFPQGIIEKKVYKGIEDKSLVSILFSGSFHWGRRTRYELDSMVDILRIRLREVMREDMGGTYGVRVAMSVSHYPREEYQIGISFGTSPDRVDELTTTVFTQIDSLKTRGTTEAYLNKVKETQRREREVNLKENSFWLNALRTYYFNGEDPRLIDDFDDLVDKLTLDAIQRTAQEYLNTDNYVKVVLYPEKKE